MKKFIIFVLMLMFAVSACAEIDLSDMNYEELVELKNRINKAMWECEEWQEVTVPQGIWVVGEDIPAGHWTISAAEGAHTFINFGNELYDQTFVEPEAQWSLYSPSNRDYEDQQSQTSIDLEVSDGQLIQIQDGYAVFTPYSGKPDLGFK